MLIIGFTLLFIIMGVDNEDGRGKNRIAEGAQLGERVEYAIEDGFAGFEILIVRSSK